MLAIAMVLFLLAAMLGIYLLSFVLKNKNTPKGIAFTHGPLAIIGLIILIIYAVSHQPAPFIPIILFILAALGGSVLIYRDLTGKSIPKALAIGHGLLAVTGFIFLLVFMFY